MKYELKRNLNPHESRVKNTHNPMVQDLLSRIGKMPQRKLESKKQIMSSINKIYKSNSKSPREIVLERYIFN